MGDYLDPEKDKEEELWKDFPLKDPPKWAKDPAAWVDRLCPRCKGHGGWLLKPNAYPLGDREDTPENRLRYCHFQAMCGSCWGFGYLQPGQECAHVWNGPQRPIGRCLTEWTCSKCGQTREIDSSD